MIRRPAVVVLALAVVLLVTAAVAAGRGPVAVPRPEELRATVEALTTPAMAGRRAGTDGGERAARRLAAWLAEAGLQPGGDGGSFLQSIVIAPGRRLGAGSRLESAGHAFETERDWTPHGGSRVGTATGRVVFLGYGISAPELGWDDWSDVDVSGQIVLVLEGDRSSRLDKRILARRHGAAALLVASAGLPAMEATAAPVDVLSASISLAAADMLLAASGRTTADLAREIAAAGTPVRLAVPRTASMTVDLVPSDLHSANVIGVLPGTDPLLSREAIVLGAHYDHLGERGGAVYPGADDNASGTAVVVALARAFAAAGGMPRTLVFALFGGEELGLIGSGHYVRHPAVPLERTALMLNFDMVGRLREGRLTIAGVDSADQLRRVASDATLGTPEIGVDLRPSPYGPSDHARFYRGGTPVLFLHTGRHADYHQPGDTADKLDYDGMARIAAIGARLVARVHEGPRPAFAAVAPPVSRRGAGADRPFLGVGGGDVGGDGVRLVHVVPGSAAERAGLRDGDVLVRIGDLPVDSFEELRRALAARNPGDVVRLVYLRDGRDHVTSATLERSQP